MSATIYHLMPCSNTAAEIDRDFPVATDLDELIKHSEAQDALETIDDIADLLLKGHSFTNGFQGRTYTLSDDVCVAIYEADSFPEVVTSAHKGDTAPLLDLIQRSAKQIAFDALDMEDIWDDLNDIYFWASKKVAQ